MGCVPDEYASNDWYSTLPRILYRLPANMMVPSFTSPLGTVVRESV
jgi:hypothetical protein